MGRVAAACSNRAVVLLAAALALQIPAPLQAEEYATALDRPRPAQAPEPLCFCWNDGAKITEGAMACIRTTQGRRLALCGRVINMMSWELSETPCADSRKKATTVIARGAKPSSLVEHCRPWTALLRSP